MNEAGLNYVYSPSSSNVVYGDTKTYTLSSYRYYPNLYAQENGSGINTTTTKTDGIGQSDSYYTSPTTETYSQASTEGLTVTQTFYNRSMSSSYYKNSTFYSLIHGVLDTNGLPRVLSRSILTRLMRASGFAACIAVAWTVTTCSTRTPTRAALMAISAP